MNFYPFHIGDYSAHTQRLSMMEDLAYRRLIDLYYLSERPLQGSATDIAREVGMLAEVTSVDYVLGKFFTLVDGLYLNKRCEDEIAKYRLMREGGKRGAEKRWAGNREAMPPLSPPQTPPNANQEPLTKNQEPEIDTPRVDSKVSPPAGVSLNVWADFLKHRRAAKAPVTDTAINGFRREAAKAGMSLEQALITSIENNWRGFKAEWIKTPQTSTLMKGVL